jgi:hypothetical protein
MDFQIYTMYVNRQDLLEDAIASVGEYASHVAVLDNSPHQDLKLPGFPGEILVPPVPLFCSQSYNLILKLAVERGQEFFFIMHSDARASAAVVEQCLALGQTLKRDGVQWGVIFTNYDVLCLHNTDVLKDFRWDQYLPVYYTDVDFYYRLKLAGVQIIQSHLRVEHANGGSQTMKSDIATDRFVRINYPAWRQYYVCKWGGDRDQETFTEPFIPQ